MQLIMTDGTVLEPIIVTGEKKTVQGARRDVLHFVFADVSMDELDSIFSEANCERIRIINGEEEAVHSAYTVRAGLTKAKEEAMPATPDAEAVYETRVTVSMAQRTYAESKLAAIAAESTDTQMAVAELAEIIMGGAE